MPDLSARTSAKPHSTRRHVERKILCFSLWVGTIATLFAGIVYIASALPSIQRSNRSNARAFANTNDGAILIGIDDAGHVKGLELDFKRRDAWERRIHRLVRTRIKPTPPIQVAFEELRSMLIGEISDFWLPTHEFSISALDTSPAKW
jgi:hypothetical protein